jgi:hypothetical protein
MNQTIELPAGELRQAAAGFKKIITRGSLPVLGCARLFRDQGGHPVVQATDLESFASYRFKDAVAQEFEPAIIPWHEIASRLMGLRPDDRLTFRRDGENITVAYDIGGTPAEQKLMTLAPEAWPPSPAMPDPRDNAPLEPPFKTALAAAFECSSDDETRFILHGAFLDVSRPECHQVVGTDGRTLHSSNTLRLGLNESAVLPRRKFLQWDGFIKDGHWRIGLKPSIITPATNIGPGASAEEGLKTLQAGWARLQSDHWTFETRLIAGPYPNWRQVMPRDEDCKTTVRLDESALELMLKVVPRLPFKDDKEHRTPSITLMLSPGLLVVAGLGSGQNEWTAVPVAGSTVEGDAFLVTFNREYFLRGLKFGFREIRFADPLSPCWFVDGGRRYIVMPIRTEGKGQNTDIEKLKEKFGQGRKKDSDEAAPPSAGSVQENTTETEQKETKTMSKPRKKIQPAENDENSAAETPPENAAPPAPPAPPETAPEEAPEDAPPAATPEPKQRDLFEQAFEAVNALKEKAREVVRQAGEIASLLNALQRDKKSSAKEVDAIREKIAAIQGLKI